LCEGKPDSGFQRLRWLARSRAARPGSSRRPRPSPLRPPAARFRSRPPARSADGRERNREPRWLHASIPPSNRSAVRSRPSAPASIMAPHSHPPLRACRTASQRQPAAPRPPEPGLGQVAFLQHYQAQAANADHEPDGVADGPPDRSGARRWRSAVIRSPSPSAPKPMSALHSAAPRAELADLRSSTRRVGTTRGRAESAIWLR
jgi:hypothetical protein